MKAVITEVRNARSRTSDNNCFDVEINHPQHGWIPYSVGSGFKSSVIDNDIILGLIGTDFAAYVAPTQAELDAAAAVQVRSERDSILATVIDPLMSNQIRWADLTSDAQAEWATYRTALLNVPQQGGFPHSVTWPTGPEV